MGLQLNISFNSLSQNKVPKYKSPNGCLNVVGAKKYRRINKFEMLNVNSYSFTDSAGCCEPSAQFDKDLWIVWLGQSLPAALNRCREDQPHLYLHSGELLWFFLISLFRATSIPLSSSKWFWLVTPRLNLSDFILKYIPVPKMHL